MWKGVGKEGADIIMFGGSDGEGYKGWEKKVFTFQFQLQWGSGRFGCSSDNCLSVCVGRALQLWVPEETCCFLGKEERKGPTCWGVLRYVRTHQLNDAWIFFYFFLFALKWIYLKTLTSTPPSSTMTKLFWWYSFPPLIYIKFHNHISNNSILSK